MTTDHMGIVLAPGKGTKFRFWSGEEFIWKVTGASTGGVLDVGELLVAPGISVPEHIHHANDETFFVLDGTFQFAIAGREQAVHAGAFVFIPRGVPHRWANTGAEPARFLLIFTPGGMDQYFVELNPLLQEPLDMAKIQPILTKYQYELVGPVPTGA